MLRNLSHSWLLSGMLPVLALAGTAIVSGQPVLAQTGAPPTPGLPSQSCHLLTSTQSVPDGFGAAYNLFSTAKEQLLNVECGSSSNATLTVGNGQNTIYVYRFAYEWVSGGWKQIALSGQRLAARDWYIGSASADLVRSQAQLSEDNFVVAYTCLWQNNSWKCGCRDTSCTTNFWQLQAFRQAAPTGGDIDGSGTPSKGANPFYTGATDTNTSCVKRYRNVAWSASLSESLVGKPVTEESLSSWDIVAAWGRFREDLFRYAKAPDGTVAMRYDIIPTNMAYVANAFGDPLGSKGVKTACFSYKIWFPSGFWSGLGTNDLGHYKSIGKMPRVWGGPKPYQPACSRRADALASGAGFTAAITPTNQNRFGLYIYDFHDLDESNCGSGPRDNARTAPPPPEGRWISFDNEVVINSPNQKNGIQRLYVNGQHAVTQTGLMWSPIGKDWGVRGPYMLVGSDETTHTKPTHIYYKDLVIYTND